MPLGLLDLSIITDRLISLLEDRKGVPAKYATTGLPPNEIRSDSGCQLSLYLFHISQDKFQRNSPVTGPWTTAPQTATRVPKIPFQPLSLNLYYILTAYSGDPGAYIQEQQAMSIALKCFHENPIVIVTIPDKPSDENKEEFCLTMEVETADEVGRLWQAMTSSLRLSVIYKVSVVFIEPESLPQLAKPVETVNLAVNPTSLPFANTGQVIGTFIKVNYTGPNDTPLEPDKHSFDLFPAVVAPGQSFYLYGAGLNTTTSNKIYLLDENGNEQDVTSAWIPDKEKLNLNLTDPISRFLLQLPTTNIPPAGIYQLRVGNDQEIRSNATPFSIAAWVNPTDKPILTAVGETYTLNGIGFVSGKTEVILDTIPLSESNSIAAEKFTVNSDGTIINFKLPTNLLDGKYSVRVRVNQVESPPAKWVVKGI